MDYKSEIQDMKKRLLFQEQTLRSLTTTLESVQKVVMQLFAGYQAMAKYLDDTALGKPDFTEVSEGVTSGIS